MLCCFPRLKDLIKTIQPKLIIALGDQAMYALTHLSGISTQRGRIVDLIGDYEYECKVLVALHPSYVMRSRQWIPIQISTYNLIHDFFKGKSKTELDPNITIDPSAEELKEYLNTDQPVGCDTETTGLSPRNDEILGYGFSKDNETAVSIAFTSKEDPRREVIKTFLEDPTKRKIWQNGCFDTGMLRYSKHNQEPIHDQGFYYDTRLAQQLLDSDLPTDLDYLRAEYTSIRPYKPSKKEYKNLSSIGRTKMLELVAWDAITTKIVYEEQLKKLSKQEHTILNELLIPLVYAIGRMENRGVLVNKQTLASLYAASLPELERVEKQFQELGINPRSNQQVTKYFGMRDSNAKTLQYHIQRNHPQAQLLTDLLEYRSYQKMVGTYLIGVFKRLENSRIHTHYKIEGTGTGRLSSEDPNLQNVPLPMRIIYEADPGDVLVVGDHSQVELWVGAIVSDEDRMLKDLQDGVDIHYIAAQLCFPDVPLKYGNRKQDFTHRHSLLAKTVVFGTFYGRTPGSIARAFGVTVAEAQSWQLKLLNHYPGIAHFHEKCGAEIAKNGYLTTPFGRRRYITSLFQGYNFPIQSSASDITLGSIVAADKAGLEPVISVHDDIVFRVKKKDLKKTLSTIKKVMERPVKQLKGISFKIDYQKGNNWYELEPIKKT
jgi:DNA polymerase-1